MAIDSYARSLAAAALNSGGGGGGGTTNYNDLENKPKINNVELSGEKTSSDLGIIDLTSIASNSSSTDVGTTSSKALDVTNISKGVYEYRNYSNGTSGYFYVSYTLPGKNKTSKSCSLYSGITGSTFRFVNFKLEVYKPIAEFDNCAINDTMFTLEIMDNNDRRVQKLKFYKQTSTTLQYETLYASPDMTNTQTAYTRAQSASNTASQASSDAANALQATYSLDQRVTALEQGGGGGGGGGATEEVLSVLTEMSPSYWNGQLGQGSKTGSVYLGFNSYSNIIEISSMSTYIQATEEIELKDACFVFYSGEKELGRSETFSFKMMPGESDKHPFETNKTIQCSETMVYVTGVKLISASGGGSSSTKPLKDYLMEIDVYNNIYCFDINKIDQDLKNGDRLVYNGELGYIEITRTSWDKSSMLWSGKSCFCDIVLDKSMEGDYVMGTTIYLYTTSDLLKIIYEYSTLQTVERPSWTIY